MLFSWGYDGDGQLGHGPETASQKSPRAGRGDVVMGAHTRFCRLPTHVAVPVNIVEVSAGSRHTLALDSEGNVWSWGWGQNGQLGHSPPASLTTPTRIEDLRGKDVVTISAGGFHSAALGVDGVYMWGGNQFGQLGLGDDPTIGLVCSKPTLVKALVEHHPLVDVQCGGTHTAALTASGTLWTWGRGDSGQLGSESRWCELEANKTTPTQVLFSDPKVQVRKVSLGAFHSACIDQSGRLWTWGKEDYGMLGTSAPGDQHKPVVVRTLGDRKCLSVGLGGWHTSVVTADGVLSFGRGEYGRLGLGDDSSRLLPEKMTALDDLTAPLGRISCGGSHSLVLVTDGTVFACGRGDHGRLGLGTRVTAHVPLRVPIRQEHRGRLSSPSGSTRSIPRDRASASSKPIAAVKAPPNAVYISAGGSHSTAIVSDLSVSDFQAMRADRRSKWLARHTSSK